MDDVAELRREVAALSVPDQLFLRADVHLHTANPEVVAELETIQQILSQTLFLLDWEVHTSSEASEGLETLSAGNLQKLDEILSEIQQSRIPDQQFRFAAAYSSEVVSEARRQLHALVREARR